MKDTILSKDTVSVTIGEDHSYNCTVVTLGRTGENAVSQLEITIPEELSGFWAYLDFKKPRGQTVKTPKLDIVNNKIEYDIPAGLLNENGNLEVQLVLQSETGEIWKSSVKKYVVLKSIDASEDIPEKEDFITEAQKVLDSIDETVSNTASAIVETVSGTAVALADVSPIKHTLNVKARSKNLIPYPFTNSTSTINGVTFTDNGDGTITANGSATDNATYYFGWYVANPIEFPKGQYTLSGSPSGSDYEKYYLGLSFINNETTTDKAYYENGLTIELDKVRAFYVVVKSGVTVNNLVFKPQLELGTEATPYAPYVADLSAIQLQRYGGNILPYPYYYTSRTLNGITFTVNEDTSITMKGTATANTYFYLVVGKNFGDSSVSASTNASATNGEYTLSKWLMYFTVRKETYIYIPKDTAVDETIYPQLCKGTVLPPYDPPKEPTTYTINADGTVDGVKSIYPTTTLIPNTDGVVIDTTYNVDTKKFILNEIAKTMALVLEG